MKKNQKSLMGLMGILALYYAIKIGNKAKNQEKKMGKIETVSAQKAAIISGQDSVLQGALEAVYDQAALDQKGLDGTLTQGDLDSAVKAATDPLNAQIISLQGQIVDDGKLLSDAQKKASDDLAALQKSLDDMTAKEQMEEKAVSDVQASILKVQSSFDAIKAMLFPVITPPTPIVPPVVDPAQPAPTV